MNAKLKAVKQTAGAIVFALFVPLVAAFFDAESDTVGLIIMSEFVAFNAWVMYVLNLSQIKSEETK